MLLNLACAWTVIRLAASAPRTMLRPRRANSGTLAPETARTGLRVLAGAPYLQMLAVLVLLGIFTLSYRLFSKDTPEVEVVRASAQSSEVGGVVSSASGYIVAHHKINLNSKVTGRVKWIGAASVTPSLTRSSDSSADCPMCQCLISAL